MQGMHVESYSSTGTGLQANGITGGDFDHVEAEYL